MRKSVKMFGILCLILSLSISSVYIVSAESENIVLTGSDAKIVLTDGTSYGIADAGSVIGGKDLASKGIAEFYDYRIKIDTNAAGANEEERTAIANAIDAITFDVYIEEAGWYNIQPDMTIYKTVGWEVAWISKCKIGVNGVYTDELTDVDFDITTEFNSQTVCTVGILKRMFYFDKGNNTVSFKPSARPSDGYNKYFRINDLTIIPKEYKKLGAEGLTLTGTDDAFVAKSDKTEICSSAELDAYKISETTSYMNIMTSTQTEDKPVLVGVTFDVTEQNWYNISFNAMADILGTRRWHSPVSYSIDERETVKLSSENSTVIADNGGAEPFISEIKISERVWLSEGVHTLWFIPERATGLTTDCVNFRFKSVTLTPMKSIEGLTATLSKTFLSIGETSPAIVVSNENGEVITNEDVAQITYVSDNNYVARGYGDGTVKARNMGSANISVCVESIDPNGDPLSSCCEIPVYVVGDSGLYVKKSVKTPTGVSVTLGSTKAYAEGGIVLATVYGIENGIRTSITDVGTGTIESIAANGDLDIDIILNEELPNEYVISVFLWDMNALRPLYGKTVVSE